LKSLKSFFTHQEELLLCKIGMNLPIWQLWLQLAHLQDLQMVDLGNTDDGAGPGDDDDAGTGEGASVGACAGTGVGAKLGVGVGANFGAGAGTVGGNTETMKNAHLEIAKRMPSRSAVSKCEPLDDLDELLGTLIFTWRECRSS
jgi:hypothetical protein